MSKAWSKDIWVDPHTFGGTRACEILADMLNQNAVIGYEKHRIISFLNRAAIRLKMTATVYDNKTREYLLILVRNDLLNRVDQMKYPIDVITHLKNILHHYYRKHLEKSSEQSLLFI